MAPPRSVVLLSGGLDSCVSAAIAKTRGREVHALTFDYGQRHRAEIEAAEKVAAALGCASHRIVAVDLRALGGSALTTDAEVPKGRSDAEIGRGVPVTYVPARNTVFLSLALGLAETLGADEIVIGANAVDYSGYPDCREPYLRSFEATANLATAAGVEGRTKFRIDAPLLHLSKAEIVRRGVALGAPLHLTRSCYDPVGPDAVPCGACDACLLRKKGFAEAGVADPATRGASRTTTPARPDASDVADLLPEALGDSLLVTEIYPCIQGESTFAGVPFLLVRLARCNLRCVWCDSEFTFKGGVRRPVEDVLAEVRSHLLPHVLVTGGEPLLQPAVHELMSRLCNEEYTVLLETGGSLDISHVDPRVRRIVDLKCPGSGEAERNLWTNVARLTTTDEVKFVVAGRADYEWARDVIRREDLPSRVGAVLLSPVHGDTALPRSVSAWILEDRIPARLHLQLHKVVWDPSERRR